MPKPRLRQQYDEGPAAAERMDQLTRRVLSVPRAVVVEKQATNASAKRRRKAS